MQFRYLCLFPAALCLMAAAASAQQSGSEPVFKSESKLVLVDAVVTDKKSAYVHDLTQKDFKVYEDNQEQEVKSFSFEADPNGPNRDQKHYLVLFFDNSTMETGDQMQARNAAGKFIDGNAGENRYIAVVNFGGSLQIAQNFTSDADKLKKVITGVKFSSVNPNEAAPAGSLSLSNAAAEFGVRDVLLAVKTLAKNLSNVPGRKSVVMLTAGFAMNPEYLSEVASVIDACNKANVAIYPIDVRGLVSGGTSAASGMAGLRSPGDHALLASSDPAGLVARILAEFPLQLAFQKGGAGGGGAGGGGSGGRGGTGIGTGVGTGRGGNGTGTGTGRGGSNPNNLGLNNNLLQNPNSLPRNIIPQPPPSSTTNQEVMYMLANGTGGFVIVNTNDLLGGLEKIAREQNQYYVLGYTPPESQDGACHSLKVKVERSGISVRSRSGYCNVKPVDLLSGNPIEKDLEKRAAAAIAGNVAGTIQVPFFYTSPNTARVNVAMEIPSDAIEFAKAKNKLHSDMNILGIVSRPDGGVAARFSDSVKLDLADKKELKEFQQRPLHYETQFDVASGKYSLKVVFSAGGESFGKLETPLVIDPYDVKDFSLSGVALSKNVQKVSDMSLDRELDVVEDRTPLVAQGLQIIPSGTNRFLKTDVAAVYAEIYEPLLLLPNPPSVGIQMRVVDRKTGQQKIDTGAINMAKSVTAGNSVVPVGLRIPLDELGAGAYRAELKAMDTAGHWSTIRSADFDVQ